MHDKSVGLIPLAKDEANQIMCLAVQHAGEHWGFPKGHFNPGETLDQAQRREFHEETGLSPEKIFLEPIFKNVYSFEKEGKIINKEVNYCLAVLNKKEPVIPAEFSQEISRADWFSFDELINLVQFEDAKVFLKEIKQYVLEHERELFKK
ncbi:MAG: NUDIX domain-containing protein [Candidatus Paceibacterota bacterium]|jgi:8-oxo-dGTP pyrophosphatase MutT (NUDIX family)